MDLESIQKFFDSRPSLSIKPIAKEIGISRQYLIYILNEDRPLTDPVKEKMEPVLFKYGYRETEPEYKRLQRIEYKSKIRREVQKADSRDTADIPEKITIQQISKLTGYAESSLSAKLSGAGIQAVGQNISRSNLYDKQEVIGGVGFKSKTPGQFRPERKGVGLQKAHEAIAKLKEIRQTDDLLQDGYDTVISWIEYNR